MKINIKNGCCIGCGACVAIDPDNFDFNEEGLSNVIGNNVTDATRDAESSCPTSAIEIKE